MLKKNIETDRDATGKYVFSLLSPSEAGMLKVLTGIPLWRDPLALGFGA